MKTTRTFSIRAAFALLTLGCMILVTSPAAAQSEEQIARAGAALAAELGLPSADQIRASNDQAFYDALFNAAQANPDLSEALAVVVVRSLGFGGVDTGKNVKNVVDPRIDEPLLQDILGTSAAAIIAGANLTGDAASAVLSAMAAALPPGYQPMMPAVTDAAFNALTLFASGQALENLRTIPLFNFSAPPGSATDFQVSNETEQILEEAGRPTPTPTPRPRPRPTPVSPDQGQVTPSQNL